MVHKDMVLGGRANLTATTCSIPRSRSHCLSLALCLQWYNGLIAPRMQSSVTERRPGHAT